MEIAGISSESKRRNNMRKTTWKHQPVLVSYETCYAFRWLTSLWLDPSCRDTLDTNWTTMKTSHQETWTHYMPIQRLLYPGPLLYIRGMACWRCGKFPQGGLSHSNSNKCERSDLWADGWSIHHQKTATQTPIGIIWGNLSHPHWLLLTQLFRDTSSDLLPQIHLLRRGSIGKFKSYDVLKSRSLLASHSLSLKIRKWYLLENLMTGILHRSLPCGGKRLLSPLYEELAY